MFTHGQVLQSPAFIDGATRRPMPSAEGVFGKMATSLRGWQSPRPATASRVGETHSVETGIPATFTAAQGQWILDLEGVHVWDEASASELLQAWTPTRFGHDQAECVEELLQLSPEDLRATLADAMEPCELRNRLGTLREREFCQ